MTETLNIKSNFNLNPDSNRAQCSVHENYINAYIIIVILIYICVYTLMYVHLLTYLYMRIIYLYGLPSKTGNGISGSYVTVLILKLYSHDFVRKCKI